MPKHIFWLLSAWHTAAQTALPCHCRHSKAVVRTESLPSEQIQYQMKAIGCAMPFWAYFEKVLRSGVLGL